MERIDSLTGIELFVRTVEAGSFAAAARHTGITPSAVSRRVAQLERALGVRLLSRTTRALALTREGQAFHIRCVHILEELREARDAIASTRKKPAGVLRVDAPIAFGRDVLAPQLPAFLERYPELRLELTLRDSIVDVVAEGLDVVIRIGTLEDSALISRSLGTIQLMVAAAPAYLRKRGTPRHPSDLPSHDCLGYLRPPLGARWRFASGDEIEARGRLQANDIDVLRAAAVAGKGIVYAFDFQLAGALASGTLVRILADHPAIARPVHALYPQNRYLLPKVSAFLDFVRQAAARSGLKPPAR